MPMILSMPSPALSTPDAPACPPRQLPRGGSYADHDVFDCKTDPFSSIPSAMVLLLCDGKRWKKAARIDRRTIAAVGIRRPNLEVQMRIAQPVRSCMARPARRAALCEEICQDPGRTPDADTAGCTARPGRPGRLESPRTSPRDGISSALTPAHRERAAPAFAGGVDARAGRAKCPAPGGPVLLRAYRHD